MRRAALATVALATLALAAPAAATTEIFEHTGAAQTWTVPAGVTQATFDLYGAQGAAFQFPEFFPPGLGGRATATIAVSPGNSIQVNVGGQGVFGGAGGFNGGGDSSTFPGGGASDIRIGGTALTDRVLVAGGGGGSGSNNCSLAAPPSGGDGGGEHGEAGLAGACPGAVGGGGGTQTAGGTATAPATPGDFGIGGDGLPGLNGGGGGGGGWYGGGGGGGSEINGGGGGGGSGDGPPGTVFETGVRSGNGLVTVTYTVQAPTIADLIDSVEALDLPQGLENSLLKKLTGAQRNLDADDLAGACDKLASFIGQVQAKSGKEIDAGDADNLIDEAEAVRESLGCGGG